VLDLDLYNDAWNILDNGNRHVDYKESNRTNNWGLNLERVSNCGYYLSLEYYQNYLHFTSDYIHQTLTQNYTTR
jgi:hypothetical protein